MTNYNCDKCGKEFKQKSHFNQHLNKKNECVNKEKLIEISMNINDNININNTSYNLLSKFYNNILNKDKTTYKSSNDEPTPIECIEDMIKRIPDELWNRKKLKILDPCCGNGNFHLPIFNKLKMDYDNKKILEKILYFNDINEERLNYVKKIYCNDDYKLNISSNDYLIYNTDDKYDLIVANPPYAKLLESGKRASKNHNLIKDFLKKTLSLLKPNGYLLFITPDNWLSYSDRNTLITEITKLQIIHLDLHSAKKYFKKIGSSFTWYIIQNCPAYQDINITGIWKKIEYSGTVKSEERLYIPLLYNYLVQSILSKTVDNKELKKFDIKTSSYLHKYTKKNLISDKQDNVFKYKLIHTPKQTVWASIPHKYQDGFKVFISTTDKYSVFIDNNTGMTQSIVFILCDNEEQAIQYKNILEHPLYVFINNITRYGNFNCIRILQSFPIPDITIDQIDDIYKYFNITMDEIEFINKHI
jgi:SAM-dependent methyltransferase